MLKYIKNHMLTIDGIEIFPVIGILIFTVFFAVVIIKTFTLRKTEIDKLKNTPFD